MTRLKAQDHPSRSPYFSIHSQKDCTILKLLSEDRSNRLTIARVSALIEAVEALKKVPLPPTLIITGNDNFFSAGADLNEILCLSGIRALEFAWLGQKLMSAVEEFPALTIAAISGYCMGGGLDLALACRYRVAAPNAVFGHRGAALGLITGWGGTQRLTRLLGKTQAVHLFTAAVKVDAEHAFRIGLVHNLHENPLKDAIETAHPFGKVSNKILAV